MVTILIKVPLGELMWYCCELGGLGWVDGTCSKSTALCQVHLTQVAVVIVIFVTCHVSPVTGARIK